MDTVDRESGERSRKKRRAYTSEGRVKLKCMLDPVPQAIVEVDVSLLSESNCVMYRNTQWYAPEKQDGMEFYPVMATYNILKCALDSMHKRRLVTNNPDEMTQTLAFLEYQNVSFRGPERETYDPKAIREAPSGICFNGHTEWAKSRLQHTCELVAMAIGSWPRLQVCREILDGAVPTFTCSSSTAWVQFVRKPPRLHQNLDATAQIAKLAEGRPTWLLQSLRAIGMKYQKLVKDREIENTWSRESFAALVAVLDQNPLGAFMSVEYDVDRFSISKRYRRKLDAADQFASDICQMVCSAPGNPEEAGERPSIVRGGTQLTLTSDAKLTRDDDKEDAIKFAFACVRWSDDKLRYMPCLNQLFHASTCSEDGVSHERKMLASALEARKIRIVQWYDQRKPRSNEDMTECIVCALFPNSWLATPTAAFNSANNISVMLEFTDLM